MPNRYLLDTHTLIWFQENNPKLPLHLLELISDPSNIILFSQVSLFEIAIKQKIGKLPFFTATVKEVAEQAVYNDFTLVSLQNAHLYRYGEIPIIENHRDPFDRLLIATAIEEQTPILSADKNFKLYETLV